MIAGDRKTKHGKAQTGIDLDALTPEECLFLAYLAELVTSPAALRDPGTTSPERASDD